MKNKDSARYTEGSGKVLRSGQDFTPGSYVSQQREWLIQAGVSSVEELNGPHIQRLASTMGIQEVEAALEQARKIGEETGITPEVHGLDLAEIVRLARASRVARWDKHLAKRVESERAKLYENLAQSVGAIAVQEADSAD